MQDRSSSIKQLSTDNILNNLSGKHRSLSNAHFFLLQVTFHISCPSNAKIQELFEKLLQFSGSALSVPSCTGILEDFRNSAQVLYMHTER